MPLDDIMDICAAVLVELDVVARAFLYSRCARVSLHSGGGCEKRMIDKVSIIHVAREVEVHVQVDTAHVDDHHDGRRQEALTARPDSVHDSNDGAAMAAIPACCNTFSPFHACMHSFSRGDNVVTSSFGCIHGTVGGGRMGTYGCQREAGAG